VWPAAHLPYKYELIVVRVGTLCRPQDAQGNHHEDHRFCTLGPLGDCRYRGSCKRLWPLERWRRPAFATLSRPGVRGLATCGPPGFVALATARIPPHELARSLQLLCENIPVAEPRVPDIAFEDQITLCAPIREQNASSCSAIWICWWATSRPLLPRIIAFAASAATLCRSDPNARRAAWVGITSMERNARSIASPVVAAKSARATARRRNGSQGCSVANRALELLSGCYRCGEASSKKYLIGRPVAQKRHADKSNAFDQGSRSMQRLLDHELRNHKMLNRWGKPALIAGNEEDASNRRGRLSKTSRELQSLARNPVPNCNLGLPLRGRRA